MDPRSLCRCLLLAAVIFSCELCAVLAGKDYYAILGVAKKAGEKEIKRAYKKQAMKWHPDKHQKNKDEATSKFQDIAEAYETLTDPEKRQLYDLGGEEAVKGQPGQPPPASNAKGSSSAQGAHFSHAGTTMDPEVLKAYFSKMSGVHDAGVGGDPFSFMFMQMPGMGGFRQQQPPGRGQQFMHQAGPLFAQHGSAVQEVDFASHETDIRKLQQKGGTIVLFYSNGGKSCPEKCLRMQRPYEEFAAVHKEKLPVAAVQCLRRKGHCGAFANKFPAVVLFGKGGKDPVVLSESVVASKDKLEKSFSQALEKIKSTSILEELQPRHYLSNADPCNGQFCLLLLERSSSTMAARKALREAARMLKGEPIRSFYVRAQKQPGFVEAFAVSGQGVLRGTKDSAQVILYRPRRKNFEVFAGDVKRGASIAEFATRAIHRGVPLPEKLTVTPKMSA